VLPTLQIGPLVIQTPGLALLAGLWIATLLIEKEALRLKLNSGALLKALTYGLFGGLVAGRLAYALQHAQVYLAHPLDLLSLSPTTLGLWVVLAAGPLIAWLVGRREGLPLRPSLDALAPGLAVLLVALGVAHLLSGNAYGAPTGLPWGIALWGETRHPSQAYEILAGLGILLAWWLSAPRLRGSGYAFLLVLGLAAGARVFLEAFRGDSLSWAGGLRVAQVGGLALLAAALALAWRWAKTTSE
jgi:phosphatidylglycerol---prolipoprotein diacylglyceryl transferase